jgi:pimeloyl-ACP methyl ester carboxylesterase
MSVHLPEMAWLAEAGYSVITFDIRGFGELEGDLTLTDFIRDSESVLCCLLKSLPPRERVLIAAGFISSVPAIGCAAALQNRISALLLLNCFASFKSYFISRYGPGLGHLLNGCITHEFEDPESSLGKLQDIPVLSVYSDASRIQPMEYQRLKRTVRGILHFDLRKQDAAQQKAFSSALARCGFPLREL